MSGEVYKSEAEYEGMTVEELSALPDLDLRHILMRVFGMDSLVYFIDKAQKVAYISQPDQRPAILDVGNEKRTAHRESNKENRRKPGRDALARMEEETKDRTYRQVRVDRDPAGTDDFTGRSIRKVFVIEDMADGSQFRVSQGTAAALAELGRLEGYAATAGRKSVAHEAGRQTAADLFEGSAPEVAVPVIDDPEEVEAPEEAEEAGPIEDDELESLLNSLPG